MIYGRPLQIGAHGGEGRDRPQALRTGLGLTVADAQGLSFSLSYKGEFGDTTTAHTVGFKLWARF